MHPQPDGSRRGESAVLPLRLAGRTTKPRSGGPTGASTGHKVETGSCAGAIRGPYHDVKQPLGTRLVRPWELTMAAPIC